MKDLLEQVMPEFEPLPDRIEQVRRKVRVQRDRKVAASAAAAVLAVVAAGAGVVVALRPTELDLANAAYQECRQENVKLNLDRVKPRVEDVPLGASKVTLCVYEGRLEVYPSPGDGGPSYAQRWDLVGARDQQAHGGAIERKVNAMAPPQKCDIPTGAYEYLMVFDYPDKPRFVVSLTDKCNAPVPREELFRGGDLLGLPDRMEQPFVHYLTPERLIGDK